MNKLQEIESQITKTLLLAFVAPFLAAYWADSVNIDLISLFLLSQSNLCTRPTVRGTVMVQLGLYAYFLIYLLTPLALFNSKFEIPLATTLIGCVFFWFVSYKAFKTAKLLSPFLSDVELEIDKEELDEDELAEQKAVF